MTEFRIPKRMVDARLHVVGTSPIAGRLFLAEMAETYAGPERPSDMLRGRRFIAMERSDGGFAVLNTANIEAISVPHDAEFSVHGLSTEELAVEAAVQKRLRVTLTSGALLEGNLLYLQRSGSQRVIDFLNDHDDVLSLRGSSFAHLVSRRHIAMIEVIEDDASSGAHS